ALQRLEKACALARTSDPTAAHDLVAAHHVNLLAVSGRLDDAAAQIAGGMAQARPERNAMALEIWAEIDVCVHFAAGRLSTARASVGSLPRPQRAGTTDLDMIRMAVLAEVAVHTDDRNLLHQLANDARSAYPTGASMVRRAAAHVLALAAWQC